jgi:hypothetical protein
MLKLKSLIWIIFLLFVSGCAFHQAPHPVYETKEPLGSTTVFAAFDSNAMKFVESRITHVNGKETSCAQVGCPYWVRVLPGNHKFKIRYQTDFSFSSGTISSRVATLEIEVKDMKEQHVYVARYRETAGGVRVIVEDLGKRADYGITLGLEGANKKYYPVKFE